MSKLNMLQNPISPLEIPIKTVVFILASFMFWLPAVSAQEILVLQSMRIKPYDVAFEGFKIICDAKIKRVITSYVPAAEIVSEVQKVNPSLIVTIGMDALAKVRSVKHIPLIYLMVLDPSQLIGGDDNVAGVGMRIPAERQLAEIRRVMPQVKSVGVLYDPARTGSFIREAQAAARTLGIELLTWETHEPKNALAALQRMKGKVELFWMLPDAGVVTQETVDLLLLSATENRIPVFTFSGKYVERGAILSLETDPHDMGRQAGEMAKRALAGTGIRDIISPAARGAIITINLKVANKLGIKVNSDTNHKTRIIR
ncbi:MAG: ABC transporter substrate binding protein [Geobacteraceae bacterium]